MLAPMPTASASTATTEAPRPPRTPFQAAARSNHQRARTMPELDTGSFVVDRAVRHGGPEGPPYEEEEEPFRGYHPKNGRMRVLTTIAAVVLAAGASVAQPPAGAIAGKVVDRYASAFVGIVVTLTGPAPS